MAETEIIAEKKAALRKSMRQLRAALPKETVVRNSEAICRKILSAAEYINARRLLAYMPIQNEVSLLPLIRQALFDEKQVYLPAVNGKEMRFYRTRDLCALKKGVFSIPEPARVELYDETCAAATLILVPGVAFTKDCARLGYGGGYYDRFLARLSGGVAWAAAYECQIVEDLPQNAADRRVDAIVTELAQYERNDLNGEERDFDRRRSD